MTRDTNFTSVFPSQSPLRLFSSHSSSSSVFYLHPSPHALASGAKFRRSKWKEFRQMHRWDKQLLTAWGLFFREGGVRRQSLLVDSDRSGRMGLYVSLSFSQRLSLQEPLDLLSCKCAMWAALRQIPCICLTVTLSLRFVGTFGGYCEFNTLKVHTIHSRYVGQHSCTFILNRISVS